MKRNFPDASQVWHRVHPPEHRENQTLQMLLQQLHQDLAFLQKHRSDDPLVQEYTEQLHCLKGILVLTGGHLPRSSPGSYKDHTLGRCYDHALQRLAAYQLRSSDPVYGPVFRSLAQQTERHCRLITKLIGNR